MAGQFAQRSHASTPLTDGHILDASLSCPSREAHYGRDHPVIEVTMYDDNRQFSAQTPAICTSWMVLGIPGHKLALCRFSRDSNSVNGGMSGWLSGLRRTLLYALLTGKEGSLLISSITRSVNVALEIKWSSPACVCSGNRSPIILIRALLSFTSKRCVWMGALQSKCVHLQ